MLTMRIWLRGKEQPPQEVADVAAGRAIFVALRDDHLLGASELGGADFYKDGVQVAFMSYNGRLWGPRSEAWPNIRPLYDDLSEWRPPSTDGESWTWV